MPCCTIVPGRADKSRHRGGAGPGACWCPWIGRARLLWGCAGSEASCPSGAPDHELKVALQPQIALFKAKSPGRSQGPNTGLFLALTGHAQHVTPACMHSIIRGALVELNK